MTSEQNRLARIDQGGQGIDYQLSEAEITPAPMVDPIVVVDYDPTWPDLFAALRAPVAAALGDVAVAIEHVGSTAVPGLAAKPIIDLDVAIRTETDLPEAIERLARLGYAYEGDLGGTWASASPNPPSVRVCAGQRGVPASPALPRLLARASRYESGVCRPQARAS
jgi:GrpB-like predicted nucleotidyltransferase (UPF0157 family)